MNVLFPLILLLSCLLCLRADAGAFLPALLEGGQKAAVLALALLPSYCVWLGFFRVMEESGLAGKLSRALFPVGRRLFRTRDAAALECAAGNLAANFLGLPGAPTPLGVKAVEKFLAAKNEYGAQMLFVLNATSLQLLPTTVIALRAAAGSSSPADIFLPTLLATLLSTLVGAGLVALTCRKKR